MKMGMSTAAAVDEKEKKVDAAHGPLQEYESRVEAGLLRDDDHQRGRQPFILSFQFKRNLQY